MNDDALSLIPFEASLAPSDATRKAIFVIIPTQLDYEGKVTIALTQNALWVVTPSGLHEKIPLKNIKDVKLDDFPGFAYNELVNGNEILLAPNNTCGVTIEYLKVGRLTHRLSFLTLLPNIAYDWIRTITQAVDRYYQETLSKPTEAANDAE